MIEDDFHIIKRYILQAITDQLTFISAVVEDVEGLNSCRTFLFVSENQVNPIVEVGWDILGLQGLPVFVDKVLRGFGPAGQGNMVHSLLTAL